jgi:hypothetical protein
MTKWLDLEKVLLVFGLMLSDSKAGIGGMGGVVMLRSSLLSMTSGSLSLEIAPSPRGGGGVCVFAGELLEGDTPSRGDIEC